MKLRIFTICLFIFFFNNISKANFNIDAKTAILQDYLSGKILYEMEGVTEEIAREAFRLAAAKLPVLTTFVSRTAL